MLQVGFARSVITPPLPIQLAGHRGPRTATAVADDLCVRALAISFRDTLAAVVSCEIIWLPRRLVMRIRELVSRTAAVRPENLMVACTHTHSGPDTLDWYAFAPPVPDWWLDWFAHAVSSAVFQATQRLAPVRASRGTADFPFAVNRRLTEAGSVFREPNPGGKVDRRLTTVHFNAGERCLGGFVHAAMHPVLLGSESRAISGDWCGEMVRRLEARHGGIWLFLNGAAGDNNPAKWSGSSYAEMLRVGRSCARAASTAIEAANPLEIRSFVSRSAEARFPHQPHPYLVVEQRRRGLEDGGLMLEAQTLQLGEVTLVALGGECLYDTASALTLSKPGVLVVSYANDYVGYLPRAFHYREGGYEPAASMLNAEGAEAYLELALGLLLSCHAALNCET